MTRDISNRLSRKLKQHQAAPSKGRLRNFLPAGLALVLPVHTSVIMNTAKLCVVVNMTLAV